MYYTSGLFPFFPRSVSCRHCCGGRHSSLTSASGHATGSIPPRRSCFVCLALSSFILPPAPETVPILTTITTALPRTASPSPAPCGCCRRRRRPPRRSGPCSEELWSPGDRKFVGEPIFVPRPGGRAEDDGWVIVYLHDASTMKADVAILDARRISAGE